MGSEMCIRDRVCVYVIGNASVELLYMRRTVNLNQMEMAIKILPFHSNFAVMKLKPYMSHDIPVEDFSVFYNSSTETFKLLFNYN